MMLTQEDVERAKPRQMKRLQYTFENMNIQMLEFQNAVRFGEWDRAEKARNSFVSFVEANCDAFADIYGPR